MGSFQTFLTTKHSRKYILLRGPVHTNTCIMKTTFSWPDALGNADFFILCFNENAEGDLIRWFRHVLMGCFLQCFIWWNFFFFFWLCCIFVVACRLSSCSAEASHCSGFSCWEAWALGPQASAAAAYELSSCGSWALEHRLSSRGEQS